MGVRSRRKINAVNTPNVLEKKTIVQVSPSLHPSVLKCIDMVRENQMLITLGKYRFSLYQAYLSGKEEPQGILKFVSIYFV